MSSQVQDALAKLLTDEQETLKRLAEKAEDVLWIDKGSGEMALVAPRSKVADKEFIGLLILSRYFAHRMGIAQNDSMTLREIVTKSGLDPGSVSSRLVDLKQDRIVEGVSRGEYRIVRVNAEHFFSKT